MSILYKLLFLFLCLISCAWTFNWSNPVDQMGKPRGHFTVTPFPITEASSSYSFTNDNGIKTYTLGTLYFVDGAAADDSGTGLTFGSPKQLLASALTLAGSNVNATIIVRGAHDAFDGIYHTAHSIASSAGQDDTHRLMIVGYGQERPVFDGASANGSAIFSNYGDVSGCTNNFVTLQRLGFTNVVRATAIIALGYDATGVKHGGYVNVIDCYAADCGPDYNGNPLNGLVYFLNADYGLISHCTVTNIQGHAYKLGDGASHCTIEWSIAVNVGCTNGQTGYYNRSVAFDFPSDRAASTISCTNHTCRYNYGKSIVAYGIELRRSVNMSVHHNEITDWGRGYTMTNLPVASAMAGGQGLLAISKVWGSIYNNLFYSQALSNISSTVGIQSDSSGTSILIYNNLLLNTNQSGSVLAISVDNTPSTQLYNNTIVGNHSNSVINIGANQGAAILMTNNIVVNTANGWAVEFNNAVQTVNHGYNLFYHPGKASTDFGWSEDATGEVVSDPLFLSTYELPSGSPGVGTGSFISILSTDFAGNARFGVYDMGAYELQPTRSATISTLRAGTLRIGQ